MASDVALAAAQIADARPGDPIAHEADDRAARDLGAALPLQALVDERHVERGVLVVDRGGHVVAPALSDRE